MDIFDVVWANGIGSDKRRRRRNFFFAKGEHLKKKKQYPEAIAQYNNAIKADPQNYRFTYAKGMCHIQIKQFDAAIAALERTVRLKSDYIQGYKMLVKCYKAKKDADNMIRALNGAFQYEESLEKKFEYKMEVIRLLVQTENYVDAKIQINTIKKFMTTPSLELLYNEALISNKMGDYKTAKTNMLEAVKIIKTPALKEIAKYYYELGYAHYKLKEYDQASEAWSRAIYGKYKAEIMKYEPKYYYQTARAYYEIYEYDKKKCHFDLLLFEHHRRKFSCGFLG